MGGVQSLKELRGLHYLQITAIMQLFSALLTFVDISMLLRVTQGHASFNTFLWCQMANGIANNLCTFMLAGLVDFKRSFTERIV